MAGVVRHRWMLLPLTIAALLENSFGQAGDFITLRSGSNLWQCPACQRVERFYERRRPKCSGTAACEHPVRRARKVEPGEDLHETTDGQRLFR